MRARFPDVEGFADSGGVKIAYEVYGDGPRTLFFTPTDPIVHSRAWKAQVPYLSTHARVVVADPRGNGRSDRPTEAGAYDETEQVSDVLAVMDAVGVERAVLVGLCSSSWPALVFATQHPERVSGVVSIASWIPYLTPPFPYRVEHPWDQPADTDEGWAKDNKFYWQRDYDGYVDFFFGELLPEAHSTKQFEDCVTYAHETTPEVLIEMEGATLSVTSREETVAVLEQVTCAVLAIHGTDDRCQPFGRSAGLAEITSGQLVSLDGAGHLPHARHPVVVNHAIHEFLDQVEPSPDPAPARRWRAVAARRKRALLLSSPIGLGHARRDLAIAQALREQRPDVEVDWMTQPPVTDFLAHVGERAHPACQDLASESAHWEEECGEHDLHAFQALRRMDEILVNNFMVFDEVVRDEQYDLVIADEAWDVDHFWHENPELKSTALAWLTDFVGFVPFTDGGTYESGLTTDYNAEMVELVARTPRMRDRSLFIGEPEDVVPLGLGDGLPTIREWTEAHYEFPGYVAGFEPIDPADLPGVREELGYRPDERLCVVSVGGSGVGVDLLRRALAAFPLARRAIPGLRMVVVTGPRIAPEALLAGEEPAEGLEVRPYVHDLWKHLAVCDLAVVQGGLTTTMELVAARRPFVYVPLRHHFEQQYHVAHRLQRYGAGDPLDYEDTQPEQLAEVIAARIGGDVDYLPVAPGGADRIAARLVDLL